LSEYITVDIETTIDLYRIKLVTNLHLAPDVPEQYNSREEGNLGSPLAQALFEIEGIVALKIEDKRLVVQRDPSVDWPILVDEVTMALKDFFL
jgi:hypothetical protein